MRFFIAVLVLSLMFISSCENKAEYVNEDTDYITISDSSYKNNEMEDTTKITPKKAAQIYVEDKVVDELKKNGRTTVVIELNDENIKDKEGEELRAIIQQNQKRLLEVLNDDDIKLLTKFDKVNAVTAEITMNGLQKLMSMPHLVEGVKGIRIIMPNVPITAV